VAICVKMHSFIKAMMHSLSSQAFTFCILGPFTCKRPRR